MNQTYLQVGGLARCIHKALPWAGVLGLWMSLAYLTSTVVVAAFSGLPPSQATLGPGGEAVNPCTLNTDGALYAGWEWWQPAGKTAFCRGENYPGVAGRAEMATQLSRGGRLLASITFEAPRDIRVELYCPTSSTQRSFDAEYVSAAEVRGLHEQVCTPAGS